MDKWGMINYHIRVFITEKNNLDANADSQLNILPNNEAISPNIFQILHPSHRHNSAASLVFLLLISTQDKKGNSF